MSELRPDAERRGLRASPRARRLAKRLGVDLDQLQPQGTAGRVCERDVRAAAVRRGKFFPEPTAADSHVPARPLSPLRRVRGGHLLASHQQTAPVTLTCKADVTELIALHNRRSADTLPGETAPQLRDLLLKLTATALQEHRALNSYWLGQDVVYLKEVHIGIAVDTQWGRVVPVLRNVHNLNVSQIARQTVRLIAKARSLRLDAEQMQGGTFTLVDLGEHVVDLFTPTIEPPQTAVLGLGRVLREPVVYDGAVAIRATMGLSLTVDQRVVDTADAARFLDTLSKKSVKSEV